VGGEAAVVCSGGTTRVIATFVILQQIKEVLAKIDVEN